MELHYPIVLEEEGLVLAVLEMVSQQDLVGVYLLL